MEKLLNHYDREYMKMAMLKHEETFREQVYELHRLYRIQKTLMKDISKNQRMNPHYNNKSSCNHPKVRKSPHLERPGIEDDQSDLELTLGPRSYYHKKIKAADPGLQSDSGPSFSSSSTGSSHIKGASTAKDDQFLKWGPEMGVSWGPEMGVSNNQDRLNSPPWLFQALSLNIT
ncbi:hypothetical protein ACS0TY_029310 [Phlomoides rotata]